MSNIITAIRPLIDTLQEFANEMAIQASLHGPQAPLRIVKKGHIQGITVLLNEDQIRIDLLGTHMIPMSAGETLALLLVLPQDDVIALDHALIPGHIAIHTLYRVLLRGRGHALLPNPLDYLCAVLNLRHLLLALPLDHITFKIAPL